MKYENLRVQAEVGTELFEADPQTRARIDFDLKHVLGETPEGTVTLYNPPDGFGSVLNRSSFVRVSAGWEGKLGTVFAGTPPKDGVKLTEGRDITLAVKVAPNAVDRWRRAVSLTSRGQKSYKEAVTDCITGMGFQVGTLDLSEAPTYLSRGMVFEGPGWRALRTLAASANADVVFDDETVHIILPDKGIPAKMEEIPKFSQSENEGNIIGSVERTDKGLEITTFFDLRLRVGGRAYFEWYDRFTGKDMRGVFVIVGVHHRGSSHGTERTTRVTARYARSL